ncbi:MAG TPA: hypothetical protein VJH94_03920 [Candidatus Paceibacterota bacterium]
MNPARIEADASKARGNKAWKELDMRKQKACPKTITPRASKTRRVQKQIVSIYNFNLYSTPRRIARN